MDKNAHHFFQITEKTGRRRRPKVASSAPMPSTRAKEYTGRISPRQISKFRTSQP